MHDGSIAALEQVIDHYSGGGRSKSARKSPLVRPFQISGEEKTAVIEFLKSLTDEDLLKDPRWSDPWKAKPGSSSR
jgi:cytochrome c peroxidase